MRMTRPYAKTQKVAPQSESAPGLALGRLLGRQHLGQDRRRGLLSQRRRQADAVQEEPGAAGLELFQPEVAPKVTGSGSTPNGMMFQHRRPLARRVALQRSLAVLAPSPDCDRLLEDAEAFRIDAGKGTGQAAAVTRIAAQAGAPAGGFRTGSSRPSWCRAIDRPRNSRIPDQSRRVPSANWRPPHCAACSAAAGP